MPKNHPKKELADKKAIFECEITNIKSPKKNKLDDDFAKKLGAKKFARFNRKIKKANCRPIQYGFKLDFKKRNIRSIRKKS